MAAPRIAIPDLPDQPAVVDTDLMVVQNGPTTKKMSIGVLRTASASALTTHLTDSSDAHLADAIGATPNTSPMTGTTVQTQLGQAATAVSTLATNVGTLTADVANKQPIDPDLTAIAALAPADNTVMQRKAGAWVASAPTTVKTDLALSKSDVGLGNVDNTADINKPISTAQQAALDTKASTAIVTSGAAGLAPASGGGVVNYLRADGTWTAPAGGGGGITTEDAVDATAAAFAAGTHTGVTVTYNDAANSISLAAAAGGTTILNGAGAPDVAAGAVGDYYEDTTNGVLYGPKSAAGWGAEQRITIAGSPGSDTTNVDYGVRVRFGRAGRITKIRYTRFNINAATLNLRVWDMAGVKLADVADAQGAGLNGTFTVALPTPVLVSANDERVISIGATGSVPRGTQQAVTNTADCAFIEYRQSGSANTFPGPGASFGCWVEPIYESNQSWLPSVRVITGYAPLAQTVEVAAGTTYSVVANDSGKVKRLTGTATVTLPSTVFATGERVDFVCIGGAATFALGAGATWDVNPTPSAVARAIGSFVTAIKLGATTWALTGDLA